MSVRTYVSMPEGMVGYLYDLVKSRVYMHFKTVTLLNDYYGRKWNSYNSIKMEMFAILRARDIHLQ